MASNPTRETVEQTAMSDERKRAIDLLRRHKYHDIADELETSE